MAALNTVSFRGRSGADPVIFSRTRHFAFAVPDGRMQIQSAFLGCHGSRLFSVRSTGHEVALTEEVHVNVIVPLRGRLRVATRTADWEATTGELLVFGPNERRTIVVPDDVGLYDALLLSIPREALGGTDDARSPRHDPFAEAGKLRCTGEAALLAAEMRELMALLRRGHGSGDMAGAASQRLADRLTALAEVAGRQGLATGSLSQLQRAEAYMEAHACAPIRMDEVAIAAGVSVRALQATFRRHRDLTPHQALTRMRLEQVHLRLVRGVPGDRVTDIALQWGFTHLGRFSKTYALRFGTTPTSTLRRAQSG